ncbi:MAG: DUF4180 domain-containing protein [Bacteroidales bacterium]|jgi:hypothetical protein
MLQLLETNNNARIATLTDNEFKICEVQDILDIMGDLFPLDCKKFIVHEANLHPDFFDLKTGLAGDILQKFSNYRVQLAVVGDFSKYESKSLRDFIYESNKAKLIFFVPDMESAIQIMK